MKASTFTILLFAVSFLAGCGGESAEAVAKDMVANLKEMGAILSSVTDESSAKAAIPKIDAVRSKMRDWPISRNSWRSSSLRSKAWRMISKSCIRACGVANYS